jgi:Flp pilus assembly secretin CpaC
MKTALLQIALVCLATIPVLAEDTTQTDPRRIEIESKFIELPVAVAKALKLPARDSFMGKFPGKPLPTTHSHLFGVLDEKEAEKFLATLNSKKSVDLCSAPRLTTAVAHRAVVEIIREFRYPTEWNPPTESEKRWTPKNFETRNVGLTLDVTPTLTKEGLIDLKAEPVVSEFLGFVDFETGKPLFAAKADLKKTPVDRTLESAREYKFPNRPIKSIFTTRKTAVYLTIKPGQTVVLDGLAEGESIEPFQPARPGYEIIVLVRASIIP